MPVTSVTAALQVARTFFDAYDKHDVDAMLSLCSDEAQVRYVPMGAQGTGPAAEVGKTIWSGLLDAFPDLHVRPGLTFGDDRYVAAEVMIGGTQEKDFLDIPSQGRSYDLPHAFILEVDDGMIAQVTAYWDNSDFYRQLGATPTT
jgi:steroid delta-isomerase-like uncharacterized protein